MFVIAVTGGIASGKSTLTSYLEPAASAIIDADEIAREVIVTGTAAYAALVEHFGEAILNETGAIDRTVLAGIVFNDSDALSFINKVTHPIIIKHVDAELQALSRGLKYDDLVVLLAPLLVEAGMTGLADYCVVVKADEATRLERMTKNRDMTSEQALSRINAQIKDHERESHADCVVVNEGDTETLKVKADEILADARRLASGGNK
jgi:dephospho-CoA kinase